MLCLTPIDRQVRCHPLFQDQLSLLGYVGQVAHHFLQMEISDVTYSVDIQVRPHTLFHTYDGHISHQFLCKGLRLRVRKSGFHT